MEGPAELTGSKRCSVCGKNYPMNEFRYGNRENRSYCKKCSKDLSAEYAKGGAKAARKYRATKRSAWQPLDNVSV